MGPSYAQEPHLLSIQTPLGKDVLLLTAFSGREEISRLFEFELELLSWKEDVRPKDLVGQEVTCTVRIDDEATRVFHGHISQMAACEFVGPGLRHYSATMVPKLWFLQRTSDCRIFQKKTVSEIVDDVLKEHEVKAKLDLHETYPVLDYCVQYRESDFDFVSRLLEDSGISYFFKHDEKQHEMVLADNRVTYYDLPDKQVDYHTGSLAARHVSTWEHRYEFVTGKWSYKDFDFKAPRNDLITDVAINAGVKKEVPATSEYEIYDFPGKYTKTDVGDARVRARIQEQETSFEVCYGEGNCQFSPGGVFSLATHGSKSETQSPYMVFAIEHNCEDSSHVEGDVGGEIQPYTNRFWCIPSSRTFRPAQVTPKARVDGPQTAIVVGPKNEEIYTDDEGYGQVKVKFPWDREGRPPEESSCWVRVSHNWAGKTWGGIFLPRIGQEVIVDFLEGDPDCPIITGRVYNADMMPPYKLPTNKTQSGIKSRSTLKGGTANFNEIRFEDKKGSEEVYFHAEKDQNEVVENDQVIEVGHDRDETIGNDRSLSVGRHKSETIGKVKKIKVGDDHLEVIQGAMTLSVEKSREMTIGKDLAESVAGKMEVSVGKDQDNSIDGSRSLSVGKDLTIDVSGKKAVQITKEYSTTAKQITFDGDKAIILTSGGASIEMKKNGDITIKGKKITIKGSGDVIIKGSKIALN